MRFIIHVGFPKTGSTTIQTALFNNRARLRALDILYPQSVNQWAMHHPLARFAEPDDRLSIGRFPWIERRPDSDLAEALGAEVEAADWSTVILSSEAFVTMASPEALISLVSRWATSIEVLVFVRRQDSQAESAFAQGLKTGAMSGDGTEYLAKVLKNRSLDYNDLLTCWWDLVDDKIQVVPLEPDVRSVDVIDVIREVCGVRGPLELTDSRNVRMNRDATELLRSIPAEHRVGPKQRPLLRALGAWSAENPEPPGWEHLFSYEQRLDVYTQHRESNAALAARCGLDELFVGAPQPAANEYPGFTIERAAGIAHWLLEHGAAADTWPERRLVKETPRPQPDPEPVPARTGLGIRARRAWKAFTEPI
ncbi:MAG: hypothetical protein IH940_12845 [Acidobacteria bacterium]|nr:hypothetical protein [Acidobacteriota bacterium]